MFQTFWQMTSDGSHLDDHPTRLPIRSPFSDTFGWTLDQPSGTLWQAPNHLGYFVEPPFVWLQWFSVFTRGKKKWYGYKNYTSLWCLYPDIPVVKVPIGKQQIAFWDNWRLSYHPNLLFASSHFWACSDLAYA